MLYIIVRSAPGRPIEIDRDGLIASDRIALFLGFPFSPQRLCGTRRLMRGNLHDAREHWLLPSKAKIKYVVASYLAETYAKRVMIE